MKISVLFVFFTLLVCVSFSHNENADPDPEGITTEGITENESVVCSVCLCDEGHIDCSEREIKKIFPDEYWSGLNGTEVLDIDFSGNPLNILIKVPDLPIGKLNLSMCELGDIADGAFGYLEELETLDLSRNQLSTAAVSKKIFAAALQVNGPQPLQDSEKPVFVNMKTLSLAFNDIHALPKDIFMFMPNLKELDLSGNPLSLIDQVTMVALSDVKLTTLSLAGCELETLPEGLLRRQRRLQRLDLSNNRFSTVPTVLREAVNLIQLNFDRNSLSNLTENTALFYLTNLQELRLSKQSRLQFISSEALGGLESLTSLHISNNPRLSTIDPSFLVWEDEHGHELTPQLEELYLNNNNITTISSMMLDNWLQLKRADFSSNPYVCDCSNQWMVEVLVPLLFRIGAGTANMICKKPNDLRGLSFEALMQTNRSLTCVEMEEINSSPGPNLAILLGFMIGIFVTFPIVLVLVILWKKGYFKRWRKVNSDDKDYDYDDAF